MEAVGAENFDLNLGPRIVTIVIFLLVLWYALNFFVNKMKSGQLTMPEFLKRKLPALKQFESEELHKIELLQRKVLVDGTEMLVVEVDGKRILLAKHLHSGISYIKDLD